GSRRESADLPGGGHVSTRTSAGAAMFNLNRGSLADPKFYDDRRAVMDLMLKGLNLTRHFGSEEVKMTSLGNPVSDVEHRDRYGRIWRLAVFALPFLDVHVVTLLLPTPDGYAGTLQFASRGNLDIVMEQVRFNSDYFYVSYA